jgi:hypothetical protein
LDRRPSVGAILDGFQDPVSCVQLRNSIFEGERYPKKKNRGSESIATDKTASLQGVCLMEIFVTEI